MTTFDAAERLNMRLQERAHTDLGLSRLSGLRARSQFVRLGNRYALSSVGSGHIYIAAKGVIGLEAGATGSDVRVITSLLYPGDILAPDLGGSLPNLALISQRPAEFWKVTASSFADETLRDADLWQTVFTRLNDQIARSQLHTAAMSMLNSEERVAAFLIEMATRLGTASSGTIAYELPLSRYSIADYLSLNADTISRTFSALATARVLERCPMSDAIIAAHGGGKPQLIR